MQTHTPRTRETQLSKTKNQPEQQLVEAAGDGERHAGRHERLGQRLVDALRLALGLVAPVLVGHLRDHGV